MDNRKSVSNVRALREKFERQESPEDRGSRSSLTNCGSQSKLAAQISSLNLSNNESGQIQQTLSPPNLRVSVPLPLPSVLPTQILKPRPFSLSEATEFGADFPPLDPLSPDNPEKPPRTFLYDIFSDPPLTPKRHPPSYAEASVSIRRKQPLIGTLSLPKSTNLNSPVESQNQTYPAHRKAIYLSDVPITPSKRKKKIKASRSVPNHSRDDSEPEDELYEISHQIDKDERSPSRSKTQTPRNVSPHRISMANIRPIAQVSHFNNNNGISGYAPSPPRLLRAKTESDIPIYAAHYQQPRNTGPPHYESSASVSQRRPLMIPPDPFSGSNPDLNPYYYPHGLAIGPDGRITRNPPLPPDHPNHSCVGILQTFHQFFEAEDQNSGKRGRGPKSAVAQYADFITRYHPELVDCEQPALFYRQGTSVTVVPPREQPDYVKRICSQYPFINYLPPIVPDPKYGTTSAVFQTHIQKQNNSSHKPNEALTKSKSDWNIHGIEKVKGGDYSNRNQPNYHNHQSSANEQGRRNSNESFLQAKAVFTNENQNQEDLNFRNHNHNHNNQNHGNAYHRSPRAIHQSIHNLVNQIYPVSIEGVTRKDATSSTDSGIQLGTDSLSSCDTPVTGDSTTDTGDSDCENETGDLGTSRRVVEERKGYIRRVSSIRATELLPIQRLLLHNHHPPLPELISRIKHGKNVGVDGALFDNLLIIGIQRDEKTGAYHPFLKYKYPPTAALPDGIERFCFPDSLEWPCHEGSTAQFYTLTVTQSDGSRRYGCCYRILPDGANICIPIAYCIISQTRAIGFYRNVLQILASRHGYSESQMNFLINDLYEEALPDPGKNLLIQDPISTLPTNTIDYGMAVPLIIRRKADPRLESTDLYVLLNSLDLSIVLKLFGSLLLERKIVLLSRHLNLLSLCVEALESMLYPFKWQHTFVPILPLNMMELLEVPAPFVIGVLQSHVVPWDVKLDEGIVVDLDQRKILSSVGDEGTILPKRLYKKLREALHSVQILLEQTENTKNVLISECFIRMFVETLGHYRTNGLFEISASNRYQDERDCSRQRIFKKELFLKSVSSKSNRDFLDWFTETSMFHQFIECQRLPTFKPGLFEQRCMEQLESHKDYQNGNIPWKSSSILSKGTAWFKGAFSKERE